MKKYIQPTTRDLAVGMPVACMASLSLAGEENQENAMAPARQSGTTVRLTRLYI